MRPPTAASAFDLVLGTSKIEPEIAVEWLVDTCLRMDEHMLKSGLPTAAELEIDPVMTRVIHDLFGKAHAAR